MLRYLTTGTPRSSSASREKDMRRGYLSPKPTRGSGERRPGRISSRKRVLEYLELEKTPDGHKSVIFVISAAYIWSHLHTYIHNY